MLGRQQVRKFKRVQRRAAHRLDDGVVPHAATVEETAGDEEGRRQRVAPEDRCGDVVVVGIAVVECDGCGARWQITTAQSLHGFSQGQHSKPFRYPPAEGVEVFGSRFTREQGVKLGQHTVEDKDAQARVAPAG